MLHGIKVKCLYLMLIRPPLYKYTQKRRNKIVAMTYWPPLVHFLKNIMIGWNEGWFMQLCLFKFCFQFNSFRYRQEHTFSILVAPGVTSLIVGFGWTNGLVSCFGNGSSLVFTLDSKPFVIRSFTMTSTTACSWVSPQVMKTEVN